jgi:L-ascorbate metabolism protein UlaG (beta-lactamase superfamily)
LGHRELLQGWGFAADRIVELDWWEAHEIEPGFHVRATPSRHWSNRSTGGRNGRLWSGFFLQAGGRTAYYVGDTAWDDIMFEEVRDQCGSPDLGIIPIGAYEPRWFMNAQHCNPTEAVRIHQTVGATRSIGVHWGTFQLTDEGRDEPVQALATARRAINLPEEAFQTLAPGESVQV